MSTRGTTSGRILVNVLAILLLLEIGTLAGLAGYLILTDKVDAEDVRLAARIYNDEITDETVEAAEKWAEHERQQRLKEQMAVSGDDARGKLAATGIEAEAERLGLLRRFKALQDREKLLQVKLDEYEQKRKSLAEIERRIDARLAGEQTDNRDERFSQMVGLMNQMKAPELKQVLIRMDDTTVVEILRSLEKRKAAKVLSEYTTEAELEMKRRYMDMMRTGEADEVATSSRAANG